MSAFSMEDFDDLMRDLPQDDPPSGDAGPAPAMPENIEAGFSKGKSVPLFLSLVIIGLISFD